jgi:peptidyl-prolyl cis-trans isomerase D
MISQRLIASAAMKGNLTVSDDTLRDTINSIPAFQEGGKFSKSNYEQVLRAQNPPMSPAQFEAGLRHDLALGQLARAVGDSAIPSRTVAQRLAALEAQKREISDARIPASQFLAQVKVDDAKIKAYYDANPAEFRTPERVRAEYVMLSAEQLAKQEPVNDAELKQAYDARAGQFKVDEQRRASHILVKSQEEADKLLAELKKNPVRFAELAKKHSQDPGSAEKGGDLGWFGHGMMVKPFEEAVFKLKENEMQVVQSDFGWHVVRVTGIQAAKSRPFEEVKKELAEDLARQKGARKFAETAENFSNLVYEQPDSLKPAAERFKLPIQTTGWITKSANQEAGALDNPKLLAALFSQDSIKNRRNTDAIEVAPNTLVSARVLEYQPEAQRSLDDVKNQIAETLKKREAADLAQKEGAATLEELKKGGDAGLKWSAPRTVSRREAQGLPSDVLRRVVSADVSKLPSYVGMPIADSGYLIVLSADTAQRMAGVFGNGQYEAYVSSLKSRADIEINRANLEKK